MNKITKEKYKDYPRPVGVEESLFIEVARYIRKRTDRNPTLTRQDVYGIFLKEIFWSYFRIRDYHHIYNLRKFLLNPFFRRLRDTLPNPVFENIEREGRLCSKFDLIVNDLITFKFSIHYSAVNFTYVFMGKKVNLTDFYSPNPVEFAEHVKILQDNFTQWLSCADYIFTEIGRIKLTRQLERTAIDAVITKKLDAAGIPYYIEKCKSNDKICFKLSQSQKAVFYIPHKCFHNQIDNLIAIVQQTKAYLKAGGRFQTTYLSIDDEYRFS